MAMGGLPKNTPQIPMQKIFYLDILRLYRVPPQEHLRGSI